MKEQHYYRLGSVTSPRGAVFIINDEEGQILAQVETYKAMLQVKGNKVTPEIERQILMYCRAQQAKINKEVDSLGIPDMLKQLLAYNKKSKAVTHCKRITITEYDLYLLAHNCSQIGFTHKSKFTEFVPEGRKVLDSDLADLRQGSPQKFVKKFDNILEERKRYHVHLFEKEREWHCFYYAYKDMEKGEKGHWEQGSHLHYLSHLWTDYRKKQVWDSFDQRDVQIHGAHIRLEPFEIDESKHYTISAANAKFLETLQ